jgi:type IV pilus assembly protein PilC
LALFYPISIIVVAFGITVVIIIFVIPAFKELFSGFGATLPTLTLIVMQISDFFVAYWWAIFGTVGGSIYGFFCMETFYSHATRYGSTSAKNANFWRCNP